MCFLFVITDTCYIVTISYFRFEGKSDRLCIYISILYKKLYNAIISSLLLLKPVFRFLYLHYYRLHTYFRAFYLTYYQITLRGYSLCPGLPWLCFTSHSSRFLSLDFDNIRGLCSAYPFVAPLFFVEVNWLT